MEFGEELLLGIDIGTLSVKCSIVTPHGKVVSSSTIHHEAITPRPGWSEQDPEKHWWHDTVECIKKAISCTNINPKFIKAVGISGLFPNMCPLDYEGKPLYNAILYSDNRSYPEAVYLNERYNLQITTEEVLPKILWFMKNEPEKFMKTKMIFSAPNYLVYKLTGNYCCDYFLASYFGGIYDTFKKEWRQDILNELGISSEILPKVYRTIDIVGEITEEAAKITGLSKGTPVIAGSGDDITHLLIATAIKRGDALIYYGTAGRCIILTKDLIDILVGNYETLNDCLLQVSYVLTTSDLLRWFVKEFLKYEERFIEDYSLNIYEKLDEKASEIPIGSDGVIVLPYFRGERYPNFNPNARGIIYGLTTYHTLHHIYRAMLEAYGYLVRLGLEDAQRKGVFPKKVFAGGGGARSKNWRQIVSDITGITQHYSEISDASVGAAFLAGLGVKLLDDIEEIYNWVRNVEATYPIPENTQKYEKFYKEFLKLQELFG